MGEPNQIDTFSSITKVSRETIISLKKYEDLLIKANKSLNLVGKSTIDKIWERHFLDSYQVIDFIDKNGYTISDLGSGAGFPGLILGIIAKDRKIDIKIKLIEKSPKKIKFLKEVIKELNLNIQTVNKNIFEEEYKINGDVLMARAFKPLSVIFELIHKKAKDWKKTIVFLGKTGKAELDQTSKSWDIKYKQKVSITNIDSMIIDIESLKKK